MDGDPLATFETRLRKKYPAIACPEDLREVVESVLDGPESVKLAAYCQHKISQCALTIWPISNWTGSLDGTSSAYSMCLPSAGRTQEGQRLSKRVLLTMLGCTFLLGCARTKQVLAGTIVLAIMGIFVLDARTADARSLVSTEEGSLHGKIVHMVRELEYPENVASDLVEMVDSWKDTQGQPALTTLKAILANSKESCTNGELSETQLAGIEQNVVSQLARTIKKQISYEHDCFELARLVDRRKSNCCGYSQLLYILGNSIDLSVCAVRVIDSVEGPMATVPRHMANVARLADGTTLILDLTRTNNSSGESTLTESQNQGDIEPGRPKGPRSESRAGMTPLTSGARSVGEVCFIEQIASRGPDVQTDKRIIQVLDRNELIAEIYFSRGTVYHSSSRSAEAIESYSKAIEANPKCARAYNNRGCVHLTLGRHRESTSDFDKAIGLNTKFAHAYYNRGNARLALGLYCKAIFDYTRAIELGAGSERTFLKRGVAYLKSGEYGRAVADFTKAIELDPKSSGAYYRRGTAYAMSADRARAKEDLLRAVRLDPALKTQVEKVSEQCELGLTVGQLLKMARCSYSEEGSGRFSWH